MLDDALAVPVFEVSLRFEEEPTEGACEAHIEGSERLAEIRDDVASEGLAGRRCAFGEEEKLSAVVGGTFAAENAGIRSPVDRLTIDDGELANLEGFGQTETVL